MIWTAKAKSIKVLPRQNANGAWSLTLPANDNVAEGALTALAIDSVNNTSPFSSPKATVVAAETDEAYVTDEVIAEQIAADNAASAEDMQVPDDVDYSDTLRELEQLEASGQNNRMFLPLIVNQ